MPNNWFSNSDIVNFDINSNYLKKHLISISYDSNRHLICFSHVPKTGGTSLESILAKNLKLSEVLHINAPDLNKQPELVELKKNHPKLICGHHPLHGLLYQVLPEQTVFHLTQLRDPVDRVLSYYNYVKGKKDHPMHIHSSESNLTDFLRANPSPELANGQAKRFSGYLHHGSIADQKLFESARNSLRNCFNLVLTTCLFDEGLLLLKKRLGLKDIYYAKHNVSRQYVSRDALNDEDLALIQSMNQADLQLFEWAKSQCTALIKKELSKQDLDQFRIKNLQWSDLINS